jgi:uncharacterized protein (TIRG00374 family)
MTPATRRRWAKLALSLLVAGSCVWLLHAGALPVIPPPSAFARVEWWALPAYLVLWSGVHLLRAVRWHWLLGPLGYVRTRTLLGASFIGFAAVLALPLRGGEVVRAVLLGRRAGLSVWAVTGAAAAERIVDGLVLSLLLLSALQLAGPVEAASVIPEAARGALALFVAAFAVMGAFYWRRDQARRLTERAVGMVSRPLGRWVAERLARTASGLGFLPSLHHTVPFVLLTTGYWLLNGVAAWVLARGVGLEHVTLSEGCVIVGVLALGFLIPNAPGFFGTFQASVYAGLLLYHPLSLVEQAGAAYVLLIYTGQLAITFGAAAGSLALGRLTVREVLALEPGEGERQ